MHIRHSALCLLLLCLCLMGRVLEVKGKDKQYLSETLQALHLPQGMDDKPQLEKNRTAVLIATLLHKVHCAERTGSSQDMCEKVRPTFNVTTEILLSGTRVII